MIPKEKIETIVSRYNSIEKELSSGSIDPKTYANKSKEYSDLGNIIQTAREYLRFDKERDDLKNILNNPKDNKDMLDLAEEELSILEKKKLIMKIN